MDFKQIKPTIQKKNNIVQLGSIMEMDIDGNWKKDAKPITRTMTQDEIDAWKMGSGGRGGTVKVLREASPEFDYSYDGKLVSTKESLLV